MVESHFASEVRAKTIGPFQRQFELVVQALDHAAGKELSGLKIIEQKLTVPLEAGRHFLERFQPAASYLPAPGVEELARPSWRVVCPEVLEAFHQKERPDAMQAGSYQVAHADTFLARPVAPVLEQRPSHLLEQRRDSRLRHRAGFRAAYLIDGIAQIAPDVKTIQDVQRVGQPAGDDGKIG